MTGALITGVAGQDGALLAAARRADGVRVMGTVRPGAPDDGFRAAYLGGVEVHEVDLTDRTGMRALLVRERPDEIYNLAAISSVGASWAAPLQVAEVNGVAVLSLLQTLVDLERADGYRPALCQASSGEMFGPPTRLPLDEACPLAPENPYAVAKAFAHHSAITYRKAYGVRVSNVVLFNHESPLRPTSFVTRKITAGAAAIAAGRADSLELGRLDIERDWGAAVDYVAGMRLALAAPEPADYVLATGRPTALGEFVSLAFAAAGIDDWQACVRSNPAFFRPTDVPRMYGDPTKAETELGWRRTMDLPQLAAAMVAADLGRLQSGREHDPALLAGLAPAGR
jgi:GDPmannose 4,6-dehydratase